MNRIVKTTLVIFLLVAVSACDSRTEKTDGGGVLLSTSRFDGLPVVVSVNLTDGISGCLVVIGEVDVQNIPKNPTGTTSSLMNVEIQSYEFTFTRADTGTRLPPPFVRGLFGSVPVGGTFTVEGLPIMDCEQIRNTPTSDLLFRNGGADSETGEDQILVNGRLRFFGRTLSGDEVETAPAAFTIRFTT